MNKMSYKIMFREINPIEVWVGRPMSFVGLMEHYVLPLAKKLRQKNITLNGVEELGLVDKYLAQTEYPELIQGGRIIKVGKYWSDQDADYI